MKRIVFDEKKCAGCNICSIACMDQNDYDPSCGEDPFRMAGRREKDGVFTNFSESCVHCGACIDVCPLECISRDPDTGFVVVDNAECIGCGACRDACPLSAPKIVDESSAASADSSSTADDSSSREEKAGQMMYLSQTAYLRSAGNENAEPLLSIMAGEQVEVIGSNADGYVHVKYYTYDGWVWNEYLYS